MDARVISIGTLPANPLWGEREPVRTGHATTTLIRTGKSTILVDPGLPAPALEARLAERANLRPSDITLVFMTSFHPECRRAIELFDDAAWMLAEPEREAAGVPLIQGLARLAEAKQVAEAAGESLDDDQLATLRIVERDVAILQRCEAAPDKLPGGVDLFPLPGVTPGLTGLLVPAVQTWLIVGDAIPTQDHLEQGKVMPTAADIKQAQDSFAEAIEIADILVLGRDNAVVNPTKRGF